MTGQLCSGEQPDRDCVALGLFRFRRKSVLANSEGAIYSRASAKDVKAFVTRRWDDLVLKFSNLRTRLLRQVFFAVTINEGSDYLVDSTGNRRFWPVMCGAIDVEALKLGVEQLWAEAVHEYRAGAKWWPSTDEERKLCSVEQEARQSHDPWEPRIEEGLRHLETVTVSGCLGILGLPIEKQGRHETLRATAVLRTLGWTEGPRTKHARSWVRGPHADPYVTPPEPISAEELAQYGHLKVIPGGLDQDLSFDDSLNLDLL